MTLEVVHGSQRLPLTDTFRGLINPARQAIENADDGKQANQNRPCVSAQPKVVLRQDVRPRIDDGTWTNMWTAAITVVESSTGTWTFMWTATEILTWFQARRIKRPNMGILRTMIAGRVQSRECA
jgi:hypothetical protein